MITEAIWSLQIKISESFYKENLLLWATVLWRNMRPICPTKVWPVIINRLFFLPCWSSSPFHLGKLRILLVVSKTCISQKKRRHNPWLLAPSGPASPWWMVLQGPLVPWNKNAAAQFTMEEPRHTKWQTLGAHDSKIGKLKLKYSFLGSKDLPA